MIANTTACLWHAHAWHCHPWGFPAWVRTAPALVFLQLIIKQGVWQAIMRLQTAKECISTTTVDSQWHSFELPDLFYLNVPYFSPNRMKGILDLCDFVFTRMVRWSFLLLMIYVSVTGRLVKLVYPSCRIAHHLLQTRCGFRNHSAWSVLMLLSYTGYRHWHPITRVYSVPCYFQRFFQKRNRNWTQVSDTVGLFSIKEKCAQNLWKENILVRASVSRFHGLKPQTHFCQKAQRTGVTQWTRHHLLRMWIDDVSGR